MCFGAAIRTFQYVNFVIRVQNYLSALHKLVHFIIPFMFSFFCGSCLLCFVCQILAHFYLVNFCLFIILNEML